VPQRLAAGAVQLAQHHLHAQRLAQLRVLPAAAAPPRRRAARRPNHVWINSRGGAAPGEPVGQLELQLAVRVLDAADHERGRLAASFGRRGGRGGAVARGGRGRARPQARAQHAQQLQRVLAHLLRARAPRSGAERPQAVNRRARCRNVACRAGRGRAASSSTTL
jgi:hypothetical protein